MTRPLLTISEFARAVDLAPSALRYYHEAGLLPPSEVDPQTGYRYYTREQERRALLLARLRATGMPVETMRRVVSGPVDEAAALLTAHAAAATAAAAHASEVVTDVLEQLRTAPPPLAVGLDGPELAAALQRVAPAASDDADSGLGVVLLDVRGGWLHVVATDRYWLALWSLPVSGYVPGERRLAVPASAVGAVVDWLERQQAVTLVDTSDGPALQGAELVLPLLTCPDRFPAYQLVLDSLPAAIGRVSVDRQALLGALSGLPDGTLRLSVGADRLTVSDTASGEGVRLAALTTGLPLMLGFSAALLARLLPGDSRRVTLTYAASDAAVRVHAPEQRDLLALAMPTRLPA